MSGQVRSSKSGPFARLILAGVVAAGLTAACAASNAPTPTARTTGGQGCLIGVSWFNGAEVMDWVEPALQTALLGAGANFQEKDARAFTETQVSDIDGFVAAGAKVIIIEPSSEDVVAQALQRAIDAGIPVVTLFSPPVQARALYVGFDPVEQGRQVARGLLTVKPRGDYAIIKGDHFSPESELIASGILEILQPAADRGDIRIVATVETPQWDPALAEREMTTILSKNGGRLDAVAVVDDNIAAEVARTLGEAGLAGKVAVGGVSDRQGAIGGLFGIVRGTQAVDAWGNPERVSQAAAEAAMALCHDPSITKLAGSASVTWPGRDPVQVQAILLAPVAITRDNLEVAVGTSEQWRQQICGGGLVPDPGWAPVCQTWTPQP